MAIIRHLRIKNFRGMADLEWLPASGLNCLIGPGDSGKSTILDAIDLSLSARRYAPIVESDFFQMNSDQSIVIDVTLGALEDELVDIDSYASYLRGFDLASGKLEDEPSGALETVLTIRLEVSDDFIPRWKLHTERADIKSESRDLNYRDRLRLAPTRLGAYADAHLAWGQRSVLNRLGEERPEAGKALANARREARKAFGTATGQTFDDALKLVDDVAKELAVDVGLSAKAILDTQEVSISTGAVALHDSRDIPLRSLGLGSSRLLVAGLQRRVQRSEISLIDEVEHGLEPYRIIQLLHVMGSKAVATSQVFLTTHSPVVLRELSAAQITVVRRPITAGGRHRAIAANSRSENQAVIRACAEAFLSPRVLVCEGKTEIGLVRGLDLFRHEKNHSTLALCGVYAADGGGSSGVARALTFAALGYQTALLRDDDVSLSNKQSRDLAAKDIPVFQWTDKLAFEAVLFSSCPVDALPELLAIAVEARGNASVDADICATSLGKYDLTSCLAQISDPTIRNVLIAASTRKDSDDTARNWFKMIEPAERIGHEIVPKYWAQFDENFQKVLGNLRKWIDGRGSDGSSQS